MLRIIQPPRFKLKLVTYLLFRKNGYFSSSEWIVIQVNVAVTKLVIRLLMCVKFLGLETLFGPSTDFHSCWRNVQSHQLLLSCLS